MRQKLNCWDFRNCGREKGGLMAKVIGECPVSTAMRYDGQNNGVAAGRTCWMIPNSGCRMDSARCSTVSCHECEFYRRVTYEEKENICFKFSSAEAIPSQ